MLKSRKHGISGYRKVIYFRSTPGILDFPLWTGMTTSFYFGTHGSFYPVVWLLVMYRGGICDR